MNYFVFLRKIYFFRTTLVSRGTALFDFLILQFKVLHQFLHRRIISYGLKPILSTNNEDLVLHHKSPFNWKLSFIHYIFFNIIRLLELVNTSYFKKKNQSIELYKAYFKVLFNIFPINN